MNSSDQPATKNPKTAMAASRTAALTSYGSILLMYLCPSNAMAVALIVANLAGIVYLIVSWRKELKR